MAGGYSYTRIEILKRIMKYLSRLKSTLIAVFVFKILLIPVLMASPMLFRIFIDDVLSKHDLDLLKLLIAGYIGVFAVKFAIDLFLRKTSNKLINRFVFDLRRDIWGVYFKLPFSKQEKMEAGDLKMRVDNDITTLAQTINEQFVNYIFNIISAIAYFILMLTIKWEFAAFMFLSIPTVYFFGLLIAKGTRNVFEKIRNIEGEYRTWQYESLQSWKEIKALTLEKREFRKFMKYRHIIAKLGVREIFFWYLGMLLYFAKDDLFTKLLIYFIGGLFILNGNITVGILFLFIQYFSAMFENIDGINQKNITLKGSMPALERVMGILDIEKGNISRGKENIQDINEIIMKNVSFKYSGTDVLVLKDISIKLQKGQYIAIVGKSGSGKSTLIKLLLKLYEPLKGEILLNGKKLDSINMDYFYSMTGVVMQDSYLFNMSIVDNLLIARPDATKEQIDNACKEADIFDFISALPDRYDTVIGEKGIKLSGGQKQRLTIARVFLRDPSLVIFDEATSSIDFQSEQSIARSLNKLAEDKIVIAIAHRFSSIIGARSIIVIDNGEVLDIGSHDDLMKRCGVYEKLYINQTV